MPDLFNPADYYNAYTAGLGGSSVPADWAPQPAQVTVNPNAPEATPGNADPQAAYASDTADAGAMPPAAQPTQGSGLGNLFGLLGGGGAAPATAAGVPGAGPGWQQGAIGLGLGLLSGNPFNKWGAAMRGYQTGAAADVARQAQINQYGYQQQELGLRQAQMAQTAKLARQQMQLNRDIAFKPQVQFRQNEDTGEWEALQYDPINGTVKNLPIGQADKIADQKDVNTTFQTPTGQTVGCPPNVNCRLFRRTLAQKSAEYQADLAAGKVGALQRFNQWLGQFIPTPGEAQPAQAVQPPRPQGIPEGAIRQESNRGNVRWKVKDKEGRTLFYDDQGRLISQK